MEKRVKIDVLIYRGRGVKKQLKVCKVQSLKVIYVVIVIVVLIAYNNHLEHLQQLEQLEHLLALSQKILTPTTLSCLFDDLFK